MSVCFHIFSQENYLLSHDLAMGNRRFSRMASSSLGVALQRLNRWRMVTQVMTEMFASDDNDEF
jgi:hypothetical protein